MKFLIFLHYERYPSYFITYNQGCRSLYFIKNYNYNNEPAYTIQK